MTRISRTFVRKVGAIDLNRLGIHHERGFSLVVALVMIALLAVVAVGVFTTVSLERKTATSYGTRYQADLAVQNGLQAAAKTLAAAPFPSPVPVNFNATVTGNDAFMVVRADGLAENGITPSYYYLAQPSTGTSPTITYYPLFSASTDPGAPTPTPQPINLAAAFAPVVPPPAPPANSSPSDPTAAWNAAGTQRLPVLYSWQQPSPSPSGPSVKWVEMRDPQDTPDPQNPSAHTLPYTRYAYWAEDLNSYLDASQVNDPNAVAARAAGTSNGTSPGEIAMFTVFAPTQQTVNPTPAPVANIIGSTETQAQSQRPLLLTVPTLEQLAYSSPSPTPSPTPTPAGAYLAVRLGVDNNPGERNLVPLGYGYGNEGTAKTPINPVSQFGPNGNQVGGFAAAVGKAMPNFANRSTANQTGGNGQSGHTQNYINNLTADLLNYVSPLDAPTEFMPPGNNNAPPASRGIGAYPFVVSLYDLNNWVQTVQTGTTYSVVIETTTYVQLWNPHNFPTDGLSGKLTIHYQNSDQVNVNGTMQTLSSPPDAIVIFTASPSTNTKTPAIVSPLFETGNIGQSFNYQIKAANGYQDPKGKIKPNEYRVVSLPVPPPSCVASGTNRYTASGLPPGLSLAGGGRFAGSIRGTPTVDTNASYTNGYQDYSVPITETTSCGTTPTATLVIRIYK